MRVQPSIYLTHITTPPYPPDGRYPNADMGFIFVPGQVRQLQRRASNQAGFLRTPVPCAFPHNHPQQQGFGIDLDTNGVELAPVSNTESDYRRVRAWGGLAIHSAPVDHSSPNSNAPQPTQHARPNKQIIEHYATPAGQPGHRCHRPRSLFLTSLGPLMERSGRRFDAFYRQPPKNPHPNLLGYEAMGDMLAFHIKVRT